MDGIKTGYTRASGFNLMTSPARCRQIVAVVLGGRSGASRDLIMANLVETHIDRAFAGTRQTPVFAEERAPVRVAEAPPARPRQLSRKSQLRVSLSSRLPAPKVPARSLPARLS